MNSVVSNSLLDTYNLSTSFCFLALSFASSLSDVYNSSISAIFASNVSCSLSFNCFFCSSDTSSGTAYFTNVKILSISFDDNCNNWWIHPDGLDLYHACTTGDAKSTCHILDLLTLQVVTSTPHLSHTIPLYLAHLYFPQLHS